MASCNPGVHQASTALTIKRTYSLVRGTRAALLRAYRPYDDSGHILKSVPKSVPSATRLGATGIFRLHDLSTTYRHFSAPSSPEKRA